MFGDAALNNDDDTVAAETAERQRALVFRLNHSGAYLDMRRRLKSAICAVAQERFAKPLNADAAPQLYSELYAYAADQMHAALNALIQGEKGSGQGGAGDGVSQAEKERQAAEAAARLEQLAAECEVAGDVARAEALHQERYACNTASQTSERRIFTAVCALYCLECRCALS